MKHYRLLVDYIEGGKTPVERSAEIAELRGHDMKTTLLSYDADGMYLYTYEGAFADLTINEIKSLEEYIPEEII